MKLLHAYFTFFCIYKLSPLNVYKVFALIPTANYSETQWHLFLTWTLVYFVINVDYGRNFWSCYQCKVLIFKVVIFSLIAFSLEYGFGLFSVFNVNTFSNKWSISVNILYLTKSICTLHFRIILFKKNLPVLRVQRKQQILNKKNNTNYNKK